MTTALYARVSTADQSLDRQKEEMWTYATETLDVEPSTIEIYEDKGTGRDTQRVGYQDLMSDVRDGEVDRVVALEVSRLSRSMRDLATTVETIVDESDTGLHVLDMNFALELGEDDPYQRAFLNITGTISQLEADMIRERVRSGIEAAKRNGRHTGRPPGLRRERRISDAERRLRHGRRDPGADRERREQSAARFAGVSRSTIGRILERAELYREFGPNGSSTATELLAGD